MLGLAVLLFRVVTAEVEKHWQYRQQWPIGLVATCYWLWNWQFADCDDFVEYSAAAIEDTGGLGSQGWMIQKVQITRLPDMSYNDVYCLDYSGSPTRILRAQTRWEKEVGCAALLL